MADLLRRADEVPKLEPSGLTYEEKLNRLDESDPRHARLEDMYPKLKTFFKGDEMTDREKHELRIDELTTIIKEATDFPDCGGRQCRLYKALVGKGYEPFEIIKGFLRADERIETFILTVRDRYKNKDWARELQGYLDVVELYVKDMKKKLITEREDKETIQCAIQQTMEAINKTDITIQDFGKHFTQELTLAIGANELKHKFENTLFLHQAFNELVMFGAKCLD